MEIGMVRFLGQDIHFPRGYGPRKDSSCWFTPGVICSGGEDQTHTDNMQNITWTCVFWILRFIIRTFSNDQISFARLFSHCPNSPLLTKNVSFIYSRCGSVLHHQHVCRGDNRLGSCCASQLLHQVQSVKPWCWDVTINFFPGVSLHC